jgi:hypothetical protein
MQEDAGWPRQAAGMPRFQELLAASGTAVDARWMLRWDSRLDSTHSYIFMYYNILSLPQLLLWQAPPSVRPSLARSCIARGFYSSE